MHRFTRKSIPPLEQERLRSAFQQRYPSGVIRPEQSCAYTLRVQNPQTIIKQYVNGTLYVESESLREFDAIQTELNASTTSPHVAFVGERVTSWVGTDECGKGDYFGSLVVAGMWVDAKSARTLLNRGVRDSKDVPDSQIVPLADVIRAVAADSSAVVSCMPDEYNRRMDSAEFGRNSARLLGWMHATVINTIAARKDCEEIVVDKFGDERHVIEYLEPHVRSKRMHFVHRAEANPAVAAASVLARERFLEDLRSLEPLAGEPLMKGASDEVEHNAVRIVRNHGPEVLRHIAKLHFKTTQRVLTAAGH